MAADSIRSFDSYKKEILDKREKAFEYVSKIDRLINDGSTEAVAEFLAIFSNKDFLHDYLKVDERLSYGYILARITLKEMENDNAVYFFRMADSLNSMIELINYIRFLIWEVEFLENEESAGILTGYINDNKISRNALSELISMTAVDKVRISEIL